MPKSAMDDLIETLRKFRDARGWSKFHTPKDLAISVSIEAGELLELFQWRHDGHDLVDIDRQAVAREAADVLLYTLMLFDRLGLDPIVEAQNKIADNARRYPSEVRYESAASFLKKKRDLHGR